MAAKKTWRACISALLILSWAPGYCAELVGRVVDATNAKVFAGAVINVRDSGKAVHAATTDAQGFFRMPALAPGAYLLDVNLPDGHDFVARLVLLPDRGTQFLELDYGRIVPPEDDEQY